VNAIVTRQTPMRARSSRREWISRQANCSRARGRLSVRAGAHAAEKGRSYAAITFPKKPDEFSRFINESLKKFRWNQFVGVCLTPTFFAVIEKRTA
jgi:hypothetical protein